jgi:dTDP-4-dehydrorhamnose reductase
MSITLLGKNGQLGMSIAEILSKSGIKYNAFSKNEVDITNLSNINNLGKPSIIINAAAYTNVDGAESHPELACLVNELAPKSLAKYCNKFDIPLIHISTDYAFDGASSIPYSVNDTPNPINVYGITKLAGELAIKKYCTKYCIIRTSWVFSQHQNNFLKTMLKLSNRKEIKVINNLYGTPTDANELAKAIFYLIPKVIGSKWQSNLWHFSGSEILSWHDFASIIFTVAKNKKYIPNNPDLIPISYLEYPLTAPRPMNSALNSSALNEFLNFKHLRLKSSIANVLDSIYQ